MWNNNYKYSLPGNYFINSVAQILNLTNSVILYFNFRWASTLFRIYGQVYALTLYVLESQDYGNIEERTMKIRSSI